MLDSWWWTEKLSGTCRVLFQKLIWEISASRWFYYKNYFRTFLECIKKPIYQNIVRLSGSTADTDTVYPFQQWLQLQPAKVTTPRRDATDARQVFIATPLVNTLRTGDADLRFYITTVQDGLCKSAFFKRACFPCTIHLIMQYIEPVSEWSCWRMFIETWPHPELTFRHHVSSI